MQDFKHYLYRLQLTEPLKLETGFTESDMATMGRHGTYLKRLTEDGTVILAGRTDAGQQTFGIVVYRAPDAAAAQAIFENDPAVAEGLMQGEMFPYLLAFLGKNE